MALRDLLQGAYQQLSPDEALQNMLGVMRSHLDMEVAFISVFSEGRRVFRHVDADPRGPLLRPGEGDPLEDTYCARVADGRLPELIADAAQLPAAAELPVTHALPVGAHLSVPIRLSDGTVYGTFCCFSREPDHSLSERDLDMMHVFAELAANRVEEDVGAQRQRTEILARIRQVLGGDGLSSVYQPIYDLDQRTVLGFECLSRFSPPPQQGPDAWFAEAESVGLGAELELKAIERALPAFQTFPPHVYLSVNLSPRVQQDRLLSALRDWPKDRLVLEITEHEAVEEYERLTRTLQPLRELGARLAVDDAGAGYASFRHILRLQPELIKLDISLTRDIDTDAARRALAAALVRFASDTGSEIIAEGIETSSEMDTLRELGIHKAQGYYLAKPLPLIEANLKAR